MEVRSLQDKGAIEELLPSEEGVLLPLLPDIEKDGRSSSHPQSLRVEHLPLRREIEDGDTG